MPAWPPPPQAIFVLIIIALIVTAGIARALLGLARFLAERRSGVNPFVVDMSSADDADDDEPIAAAVAATIPATQQQSIALTQNERNALLLQAKAEALAAMVEAGLVTETKGLQIVFGVRPSSTNPRYIAARDALHAELEKRTTPIANRPTAAKFAPR